MISRRVRGIRTPIPAGYILGRVSSGEGDVELIDLVSLAQSLQQTSLGGGGGASLPNVAADVGTFTNATVTIDPQGRVTAAHTGGMLPLTNGDEPPIAMSDGNGQFIGVPL